MIQSNPVDKIKSHPSFYSTNVLFRLEIGLRFITKAKSTANYDLCNISNTEKLATCFLLSNRLCNRCEMGIYLSPSKKLKHTYSKKKNKLTISLCFLHVNSVLFVICNPFCNITCISEWNRVFNEKKCIAELDFIRWELIGCYIPEWISF